jgi:hypothetical protein
MTARKELFDYVEHHTLPSDHDKHSWYVDQHVVVANEVELECKIEDALSEARVQGFENCRRGLSELDDDELAKYGLMRVPRDANGEQVHFGDRVHFYEDGQDFTVNGFLIKSGSNGWWVYEYASRQYLLHSCTLVRKPTVRDVLLEMYDRLDEPSGDDQDKTAEEIIAEYVDRLQLKEK